MTQRGLNSDIEKVKKNLKKEKREAISISWILGIASTFILAAVFFWTWPAILHMFPVIKESTAIARDIGYWHWFGLIWFVRSIRSLIIKKWQ
jgi:hypothetical protein